MDSKINNNSLLAEITSTKQNSNNSITYNKSIEDNRLNFPDEYNKVAERYNKPSQKDSHSTGKSNTSDGKNLPKPEKAKESSSQDEQADKNASVNEKESTNVEEANKSEQKDVASEEDKAHSEKQENEAKSTDESDTQAQINNTVIGITLDTDKQANQTSEYASRFSQALNTPKSNQLSHIVQGQSNIPTGTQATVTNAEATEGTDQVFVPSNLESKQVNLSNVSLNTEEALKQNVEKSANGLQIENTDELKEAKLHLSNDEVTQLKSDSKNIGNQIAQNQFEIFDKNTIKLEKIETSFSQIQTGSQTSLGGQHGPNNALGTTLTTTRGQDLYSQILSDAQGNKTTPIQTSSVQELPNKVQLMLNKNENTMRIMLEPPELGQMEIKLQQRDGVTNITFNTPMANTKEIVEGQLNDLKMAFQQQGIDLGDVNVYQDNNQGEQTDQEDFNYTMQFEEEQSETIEMTYSPTTGLDVFV